MKSLKELMKVLLSEIESADSMWSRASANKKQIVDKDKSNSRQADGEEIADKMEFEKEKHKDIRDKTPIKMLDLVMKQWKVK